MAVVAKAFAPPFCDARRLVEAVGWRTGLGFQPFAPTQGRGERFFDGRARGNLILGAAKTIAHLLELRIGHLHPV